MEQRGKKYMLKKNKHLIIKLLVVVVAIPLIVNWLSSISGTSDISTGDRRMLYGIVGLVLSLTFLYFYDRVVLRVQDRMKEQVYENKRDISKVKYELTILKSVISSELGVPYSEVVENIKKSKTPIIVESDEGEEEA